MNKNIAGGISVISERYCRANNIHVDGYERDKKPCSIFYTGISNWELKIEVSYFVQI